MASQTSSSPPALSSFVTAANEWLGEDYASSVVWEVLDAREHIPSELKRALDTAIRGTGVRVPGAGFQLQDVQDAPTHHLHSPVFRKMQSSDELTEAVLRAWVGIQGDLYESVVQHLQWNDEPTYGPDRQERSFRGYWDARDWQTNYNQFLADRTGFENNDVGLMLWYVSGKLPPPLSEVEDPSHRVDFERWKELLLALRPDAPQWEEAMEFAAAIAEIREEKEKQRARDAVNQLRSRLEDIWIEYSDELIYLEKDIGIWGAANKIQPEEALQTLEQVNNLESLLEQYRPIRDQAQSRSVESSRAGRRAELEAEIISTVGGLEPNFVTPVGDLIFETTSGDETEASPEIPRKPDEEDDLGPDEVDEILLGLTPADEGTDTLEECEDVLPLELLAELEEVEVPALEQEAASESGDVSTTILAGLQSLREDLELLKAQLVNSNGTGHSEEELTVPEISTAGDEQFDTAPADGLTTAILRVQERFPRQLLFRLNSESWVNGNPYEDPQSVADALEWLASTYVSARQGDMDFEKLNESLYQACRWKYSNNQHDRTFFQNEGHYRMLVNGKAYYLNETIGKGVGGDPVNTIRIAFYWDRQRERVVIGYIGQHQQSANE